MSDDDPDWSTARTAADLPSGHRENLVWHRCWLEGFSLASSIAQLPVHGMSCRSGRMNSGTVWDAPEHALLGADGSTHLAVGSTIVCCRSVDAVADPESGGLPRDLLEVPPAERCDWARRRWPGWLGDRKLGRVRRQLVDEFGPRCAICSDAWAAIIDHDHLTGRVRGYVCRDCNGQLDNCAHLTTECAFATYLLRPPAYSLNVEHPFAKKWRKEEKYTARAECFKAVMSGRMSPGFGLQPGQ